MSAACASPAARRRAGRHARARQVPVRHGTEELNEKNWLTAREYFRQLMESYPQSQYRADAKLGIGDTYLGEAPPNPRCSRSTSSASSCRSTRRTRAPTTRSTSSGMAHFYQMRAPSAIRPRRAKRSGNCRRSCSDTRTAALMPEAEKRLREAKGSPGRGRVPRRATFTTAQNGIPGAIDRFKKLLEGRSGVQQRATRSTSTWPSRSIKVKRDRRGAALLRAAREGIREERVSGRGQEARSPS